MRDAFVQRLTQMAARDPRIMLITGDLGFGVLTEFSQRFPRQFLNAGVAEQNMTGLATGLAMEGHIVYTYSIANFVFMRCLEQIRNDAAYHDCNVNVVCVGGGFSYGALGISHHATEDLAIMRSVPGMTVVSPGDNWEAAQSTEALAETPGPSYLRLDKSTAGQTERPGEQFRLGAVRQLCDGDDLTIAVTGGVLEEALWAAEELRKEGIHCRVLSVHTIKPLDIAAFARAATETGGLITVEEHTVDGGLGGAIAERLMESGVFPRRFMRIGLREGFSSIVGSQKYLRSRYGMDGNAIVASARSLVESSTTTRRLPKIAA